MELPYSAQPVLARLDFGSNYVNIQSGSTSPNISSIVDVISGEPATQTVVANQPTFNRSVYRVAGFYDSASFNKSTQVMAFDTLAATIAPLNSFTAFVAFNASSVTGLQDLFTFGKTGADGYWQLALNGSAVQVSNKNDTPTTVVASGGTVVAAANQWAAISVANGTMSAYLNGPTAIASASVSGTTTVSTCSIGALRNNSTTANYFGGSIYEIVVFKGLADMTAVGTYFTAIYEPYNTINRTY